MQSTNILTKTQQASLKLGSQFLLAKELKDYPNLIEPLSEKEWQNFFREQAKNLKKDILKD